MNKLLKENIRLYFIMSLVKITNIIKFIKIIGQLTL